SGDAGDCPRRTRCRRTASSRPRGRQHVSGERDYDVRPDLRRYVAGQVLRPRSRPRARHTWRHLSRGRHAASTKLAGRTRAEGRRARRTSADGAGIRVRVARVVNRSYHLRQIEELTMRTRLLLACLAATLVAAAPLAQTKPENVKSPRIYVFDNGTL